MLTGTDHARARELREKLDAEARGEVQWVGLSRSLTIRPLPRPMACPIPVTPEGRTVNADGKVLPIELRTKRCAVWAHWTIDDRVSCDCCTAAVCELLGIDFDALVLDAGRDVAEARVPWAERSRSSQTDAELTLLLEGTVTDD